MVQMALQEVICNGLKTDNLQTNRVPEILSKYEGNIVEKETDGNKHREKCEVEEDKDKSISAGEDQCLDMLVNNECEINNKNDLAYLLDESSEIFNSTLLLSSSNFVEMAQEKDNLLSQEKEKPVLDVHDCLVHPTHLTLVNKLEASKNTISNLEETINRLEKQLSLESNKTEKIVQLEKSIFQYEKEIQLCKQEHEIDQRTIATLKKEMDTKLSSMKKQYETANREKENIVMRYAVSEKELLDCKKEKESIDKKMKELVKEHESSLAKLKTTTNEKIKVTQQLESKAAEVSNAYKEIDKLKDEINSRDIKIKWTQNKLKSEMDAHKECSLIIDKLSSSIKTLENEIDSYRKEITGLNLQLEQNKILESKMKEQESNILLDRPDLISANKSLQSEYQALVIENNLISHQVENVEQIWLALDRNRQEDDNLSTTDSDDESPSPINKEEFINLLKQTEHILSEVVHLRKANAKMISDISACQTKSSELLSLSPVNNVFKNEEKSNSIIFQPQCGLEEQVTDDYQTLRNRIKDLEHELIEEKQDHEESMKNITRAEKILAEVETLRCVNEELMSDISACKSREAELLAFTQKLTSKNVELQSEFTAIKSKTNELEMTDKNHALVELQLKQDVEQLQRNLTEEKERRQEETRLLARQVAEKTAKAENLLESVTTLQSELSLLKNKHAVQVKELQRELSQYKRKIEQLESSATCIGSTPNSLTSGSKSTTSSLSSLNDSPVLQGIDVPAHVLVDRIVRLQQESAKQSDRIEFLEEHSTQLVKELQKKSRLLQNYIMREQTGTLTSNSMDRSKAELSKTGGIMASLYGTKPADETMTFELCLEINRKLQAVLEDTLLKNITLKENIDTLGDEIARLSQKKS